jgi:hypothetical protein
VFPEHINGPYHVHLIQLSFNAYDSAFQVLSGNKHVEQPHRTQRTRLHAICSQRHPMPGALACRTQATIVPAGTLCPSSSSSLARVRVTTGTTLYFLRASFRTLRVYVMASTSRRDGSSSAEPNVNSASACTYSPISKDLDLQWCQPLVFHFLKSLNYTHTQKLKFLLQCKHSARFR